MQRIFFLRLSVVLVLAAALASCTKPPATDYDSEGSTASTSGGLSVGQNTAGESCNSQAVTGGADVYCGSWDQPSAHVQTGGPAGGADLATLATSSPWRASLEGAYSCAAPTPGTILDGVPAEILSCTQRYGGWPHVALATIISGNVYYADGVLPALPPMQRAVGVVSGRISAAEAGSAAVAASDQVLAQRLASQAFSSGDIGQYEALMTVGSSANQAEDFPSAVIAYRAALALQEKKLGSDDPATVGPMLELALNLSDAGQYPEADSLFIQAAAKAPRSSDPTAYAKLLHYRGLDELNEGNNAKALSYLREAETAYAALLPPDVLLAQPTGAGNQALFSIIHQGGGSAFSSDQTTLNSPVTQTALLGVIDTWRYQSIALSALGDKADADAAIGTADRIAAANDLEPPMLGGRLQRTSATLAVANGQTGAASNDLDDAAANFSEALPGSRPVAETELLEGKVYGDEGKNQDAVASCREGISLLQNLKIGTSGALISPCLDAFAAVAANDPTDAEKLYGEMFEAAELAQGSVTAQEIAEASARLSSSSSDPKAAAAIRAQQDDSAKLADLYHERDEFTHQQTGAAAAGTAPAAATPGVTLASLDAQIASANAQLQQADLAVQAAAPNFGQLVQQVVPASEVLKLLRPDEGFLGITATPDHTWLFFLHDGNIQVARNPTNDAQMSQLVSAVRASIEPTDAGTLPSFDMADAATIYGDTVGPFATTMGGVHELVVAPSGPLLALPFSLLPTAKADPTDLAGAPWLVRQTTLAYVPAAANFVSLRKIEGTSAAAKPWFGFGDFQPVTLAQAEATYNTQSCHDSAAEFAQLPILPYAKLELEAAAAVFGAGPDDELLGPQYTVPNVEKADLKNYQILHFATHALLPTDLPCQTSPAIVTSAPPGATSADQALLNTADVTGLKLDANLVLLSACNTGGGSDGGQALSGLARSFFYAGARALMVTQWSVNDQVSAYLVADTLNRVHEGSAGGAAGSLRAAQLGIIDGAGHSLPAQLANPFFWAAFAVIGDGGAVAHSQLSALSGTAAAGL